ncbi:MAG: SpoIIE family protein phosphatase [Clostridia bacterium]|nr:SpoIIE family protein phosphatase [Clostridia bacterium]
MKKFKNLVIGGIRQKVFNLVLFTIIILILVYGVALFYQSRKLASIVKDSSDSQKNTISAVSGDTMKAVLENNLTQSVQMEAYIAKTLFDDAEGVVTVIADYAEKILSNPGGFPYQRVSLPDKDKDGDISVQVLTEEGVSINDPAVSAKLGLVGNLADLMIAEYEKANIDSCYVALPEGAMLLVDDHSASKFDEDGNIISIPIRERQWYTGAAEAEKLTYTDVTTDLFTGNISIMCSLPIYSNGKLVAVIGADLFLNDVSKAINDTANQGSFTCIINQNGHVIFSPQKEGTFAAFADEDENDDAEPADLRESENKELAAFIKSALKDNTELELITIDGEECYVVGSPIQNLGWTVVSVVPKTLADMPASAMLDQFNDIQNNATAAYRSATAKSRLTLIVLLVIATAGAFANALIMSKRVVKPLEIMTERVKSLGGDDLLFEMDDAYRTDDEIELLAESFAMLSGKTLEYIEEVQRVTSEKERIGAELSLATRIQADMLPNIYPAFPDRKEIDVYASMDPAKEVGGDFYNFFLVDDDHLCVFIADVSGKGVPAALFMMASTIVLSNNAAMGKSPAQILRETNEAICSNNREEMFLTVWLGILELSTGKLTAANAGHEFPVIKTPDGKFELLKDKHGLVLGGMSGAPYKEYEIMLKPGSKLFLYTDGVPEATNIQEELFGTDRMLDALNTVPDASPKDILQNVRTAVDCFVKDAEQFDDLTMVCVEYKEENKEKT